MKAKFVFEFYDRDDPDILKKLGIGKKTWGKLQLGDILKPSKLFKLQNGKFKSPSYKGGTTFYEEDFVVITSIRRSSVWNKKYGQPLDGWEIGYYKAWDLAEARIIRKRVQEGSYVEEKTNYYSKKPISATQTQLENRFDIYEE